jgi:hypothetical protein
LLQAKQRIAESGWIILAIDSWSQKGTFDKYFGVHCFVYDSKVNNSVQSIFLDFTNSEESKTADYLQKCLENTMAQYEIPKSKVLCIITDGGSNMKKLCDLMDIPRFPCFAHLLNLVENSTTSAVPVVEHLTSKVRSLLAQFAFSQTKKRALDQAQSENNSDSKGLLSYSPTRWDSFFDAATRLMETGADIQHLFERGTFACPGFSTYELCLLDQILVLLGIVKQLTDLYTKRSNGNMYTDLPSHSDFVCYFQIFRSDPCEYL